MFRPSTLAKANMAESGNAAWKPKTPLSLLDVAKDDAAYMICQVKELEKFAQNEGFSTRKGPSTKTRGRRERHDQITWAKQYAEMLENNTAIEIEIGKAPAKKW